MDFAVVYDTEFGNTATIAEAIAQEVAWFGPTSLLTADDVVDLATLDSKTLIVGGPTRHHGVSDGIAQLLDACGPLGGTPFAAFDTRYHVARWRSGSAAHAISRRLRHLGGVELVAPHSFFVVDERGPVEAGQVNLARDWAIRIGEKALVETAS